MMGTETKVEAASRRFFAVRVKRQDAASTSLWTLVFEFDKTLPII
jgi:hypothetical protein